MKYIFFLLLLLPYITNSQPTRQVKQSIQSQTVILSAIIKVGDKFLESDATGFVLNENYIGTCYHLMKYGSLAEVAVFYNFRMSSDNKFIFDTAYVDLNYKANKNQYDFSKHKYVRGDYSTDFVIFKLNKNIPSDKLKYSDAKKSICDTVYSYGLTGIENVINVHSALGKIIFFRDNKGGYYHSAIIGNMAHGFSGGLIYNIKGEVIGMLQYGWDEIRQDHLTDLVLNKTIKPSDAALVNQSYKKGDKLNFAININYLRKKYFKGYE